MLLCSGRDLVVFIIHVQTKFCTILYYQDVALYTFYFNLWKEYQTYRAMVHKFLCFYMDTVRINEIHLWLNKVSMDINLNLNLAISCQKKQIFCH